MRGFLFLPFMAVLCFAFGACSGSGRLEIEYLPVHRVEGQVTSLLGPGGDFSDYDFMGFVSPVVNGYFTVKGKRGYDVYRYGSDVPVEGLDGLYWAGYMSEGLMPLRRKDGGELEVADGDGDIRFALSSQTSCADYFTDGMLLVGELDGESYQTRWGAVNTDGELTVPMKYDDLYRFNDGCAPACLDGKWMLISHSGKVVAEFDGVDHVAGSMLEDRVVATRGGQYGFCDRSGSFSPLGQQLVISDFNGRYAVVSDAAGLAYGVVDTDGEPVIPLKYKSIQFYGTDCFVAWQSDGVYLLLDSDAATMAEIHEKDVYSFKGTTPFFSGDFLVGGQPGCYYLYGTDGKRLGDAPFYQLY